MAKIDWDKAKDKLGDFVNEGVDTYKEAETWKAVKENAVYLAIAAVLIVLATYYVTKKMK